jgi:hypothetical protein
MNELVLLSEGRAVCINIARTDLCGGCWATDIPTATTFIQAMKMVLDRTMPPRRERSVIIDLPALQTASDAVQSMALITEAVGMGDISPSEGEALSRIIDTYVKAIEAHDYERRLNILENSVSK